MKSLVLSAAILLSVNGAFADETLKFRTVTHASELHTIPAGDVDGHLLGVSHSTGIVFFSDESVGTAHNIALTDYTKGVGDIAAAYWTITASDGSTLWFKVVGNSKSDNAPGKFKIGSTQMAVLGGRGRFEGAKGNGSLTGLRINLGGTNIPSGTNIEMTNEMVINLKK
jgi:hypothetical protein